MLRIHPLPVLDAAGLDYLDYGVGLPTRRATTRTPYPRKVGGRTHLYVSAGHRAAHLRYPSPAADSSLLGFRRQLNPASRPMAQRVPDSAAYLCAPSAAQRAARGAPARYWSAAHAQRE